MMGGVLAAMGYTQFTPERLEKMRLNREHAWLYNQFDELVGDLNPHVNFTTPSNTVVCLQRSKHSSVGLLRPQFLLCRTDIKMLEEPLVENNGKQLSKEKSDRLITQKLEKAYQKAFDKADRHGRSGDMVEPQDLKENKQRLYWAVKEGVLKTRSDPHLLRSGDALPMCRAVLMDDKLQEAKSLVQELSRPFSKALGPLVVLMKRQRDVDDDQNKQAMLDEFNERFNKVSSLLDAEGDDLSCCLPDSDDAVTDANKSTPSPHKLVVTTTNNHNGIKMPEVDEDEVRIGDEEDAVNESDDDDDFVPASSPKSRKTKKSDIKKSSKKTKKAKKPAPKNKRTVDDMDEPTSNNNNSNVSTPTQPAEKKVRLTFSSPHTVSKPTPPVTIDLSNSESSASSSSSSSSSSEESESMIEDDVPAKQLETFSNNNNNMGQQPTQLQEPKMDHNEVHVMEESNINMTMQVETSVTTTTATEPKQPLFTGSPLPPTTGSSNPVAMMTTTTTVSRSGDIRPSMSALNKLLNRPSLQTF